MEWSPEEASAAARSLRQHLKDDCPQQEVNKIFLELMLCNWTGCADGH